MENHYRKQKQNKQTETFIIGLLSFSRAPYKVQHISDYRAHDVYVYSLTSLLWKTLDQFK